jgi:peptidoglycan/LPS O-acetylase OafA/YrhL
MNKGYIRSLDGLRAVAVILVMSFHYQLNYFGWAGVLLFFVLSGFLITRILWMEKFKQEPLFFRFKKFWLRRSLRIFPLYYAFLLILGLSFFIFHFPSYYQTFIPWLATYTFNYTRLMPKWLVSPLFTHLWSLSIEEQFYLIFPFFIFLCPTKIIRLVMPAMLVLGPFIRWLLGIYYIHRAPSLHVAGDAVYWNTMSHLDAFCMGGLIPVLALEQKIRRPSLYFAAAFSTAVLAGILNFVYLDNSHSYASDLGYNHAEVGNYQHVWCYTLLNLLFASFILMLVSEKAQHRDSLLKRILESNWMVNIGRVSYGMYIFHWAIMVYVTGKLFPFRQPLFRMLSFIPYVAAVYFFSVLSFRFFESYFIKLKDRQRSTVTDQAGSERQIS